MEQSQENNVLEASVTPDSVKLEPSTPESVTPAPVSVGAQLRAARERLGLSVDDVVAQIKLAPRQVMALEQDDFSHLPETAFLRGFVRSYARLLQLDALPLLDALPGAPKPVEAARIEAALPSERTVRQQNIKLLSAALAVAVGIAVFAVWQSNAPPEVPVTDKQDDALLTQSLPIPPQAEVLSASAVSEVAAASAVSAVPAPSAVAAAPAASVAPVTTVAPVAPAAASSAVALRLVFDKEAWAEIKDKNGKSLSNQLNHAGTEVRVEGEAPFSLVVGHASAVHLFAREKPVAMTPNAYSDVARLKVE